MKPLKITLMLAVFCLTFSGTSNSSETELTINQEQIESYQTLKKESIFIVDLSKKNGAKPGQENL